MSAKNLPSKRCRLCGKRFSRGKAESNYAYERRAYCTPRCERTANHRGERARVCEVASLWEGMVNLGGR